MKTYETVAGLIAAYVNGEEEGVSGNIHFMGPDLYSGKVLFAKRSDDGDVLLGQYSDAPEEVNDTLIAKLVSAGKKFNRIGTFRDVLNASLRLADFRAGRFDKLNMIAKAFGKSFSEDDRAVYDEKSALLNRHAAELSALEEKVSTVETTITSFFTDITNAQAEARKKAEEATLDERTKAAIAKWEANEALARDEERLIKGQGGGQRLKTVARCNGRLDVVGSAGHNTTLNQIRQAFNKLTPYLFGSKELEDRYQRQRFEQGSQVRIGETRSYGIEIDNKGHVNMGCQQVTKSELERFALSQGWPVDGSPVPA